MIMACAVRAVVGSGLQRSDNVASIARTGVGAYTVTLARAVVPTVNAPEMSDGWVFTAISGPFKIDGDFVDSTHITVQILNLSGAAADPSAGTNVRLLALQ